jgi:hypothetical protein
MHIEKTNVGDTCSATIDRGASYEESTVLKGSYQVDCHDASGVLKWSDVIGNLVTTVGKNSTMDTMLGNVAVGAVVMGLKGTGTAVVADTQASHASWLEVGLANAPTYSGTRKTPVFSVASAGAKATSAPVVFTMTGSGTIAGCFINLGGSATQDNTTGVLFSAGDFTAGSKIVTSGDTLSCSYTATAA